MYNEDNYRRHLKWLQAKRIILMVLSSVFGCVLGVVISSYIVNILAFDSMYRVIIITVSTLVFFTISVLSTSNTAKEIQDGYWKIATLRKLTLISKKLDALENLNSLEVLTKLDVLSKQLSTDISLRSDEESSNGENERAK